MNLAVRSALSCKMPLFKGEERGGETREGKRGAGGEGGEGKRGDKGRMGKGMGMKGEDE